MNRELLELCERTALRSEREGVLLRHGPERARRRILRQGCCTSESEHRCQHEEQEDGR